ncbi:hypothetical protein [Hymenobacter psoromatis]|uniref:hypothetical protein n=1 Tax=Hymenobacter psoromatis TaxID=1484116 RepID=UPI001CBD5381|nr:hypothetical protein [Hymenobacter psoromatis]
MSSSLSSLRAVSRAAAAASWARVNAGVGRAALGAYLVQFVVPVLGPHHDPGA